MICIVLAAGYATRLYPLTENFPKPLLKVGGKTILDRLLEDIDSLPQVTGHIVVSNHKFAEHFNSWLDTRTFSNPVTVLDDGSTDNSNRLGAVRDIKFAVDTLSVKDDVLVVAGDNILDFSFGEFIKYAEDKNASCVMCHEENNPEEQRKTAIITKDENDVITSCEEKPQVPKGNLAVPPFYFYKSCDVSRIEEAVAKGCSVDAPGSFAAWLSTVTKVYAWTMTGKRYDIGDMESYNKITEVFGK